VGPKVGLDILERNSLVLIGIRKLHGQARCVIATPTPLLLYLITLHVSG